MLVLSWYYVGPFLVLIDAFVRLLKYLVHFTSLHRTLADLFVPSVSVFSVSRCSFSHCLGTRVHAPEDDFVCTFDVQRSNEVNYGREVAPLSAKCVSRSLSMTSQFVFFFQFA